MIHIIKMEKSYHVRQPITNVDFRWLRNNIHTFTPDMLGSMLKNASKKGIIRDVELLLPLVIINGDLNYIHEALVEASSHCHTTIMKLLLNNGADVQYDNNLPLKNAVTNGHSDAVKILLDNGANVHVDSNDLLAMCCEAGDYDDVLTLLIEYGIDISKKYQLAINLSFSKGRKSCMQVLVNYNVKTLSKTPSSSSIDNDELLNYEDTIEDVNEYNEIQSVFLDGEIDEE